MKRLTLLVVCMTPATAQSAPMLPDSTGWGIKARVYGLAKDEPRETPMHSPRPTATALGT